MAEIIELKNLTKRFGSGDAAITALEGIDLSIERGEIFGVIGLSGAGKSTLVRCMNLLEVPTEGSVFVDGEDLTKLSDRALLMARRSISMIFQGFCLLMQRTALENICFPMELAGISKKDARVRGRELLKIVGLEDREKAYPAQLSGGQKQRVAIARALALEPKVLLCDEATSALDPTTTLSILELLKELNQTLGVTIVIITHEMKVVEQICSRVAIIANSHIEEIGDVSEVFRHPKTAAAKELIFPAGESEKFSKNGPCLRVVFDGTTTEKPIISDMVLKCDAPVNILFADTKNIDERIYGHMILRLPENPILAQKMLAYLDAEHIEYSEEAQDVHK
ncbi:MAG: ATP-binding cassette domain-containing protein [Evtepia sp.]